MKTHRWSLLGRRVPAMPIVDAAVPRAIEFPHMGPARKTTMVPAMLIVDADVPSASELSHVGSYDADALPSGWRLG